MRQVNKQSPYVFYEIVDYPRPFQSDFFSFGKLTSFLGGGEPLTFSWGKASSGVKHIQQSFSDFHKWFLKVPFIQSVYLTGKDSFNCSSEDDVVYYSVVVSSGRFRFSFLMISCLFFFKNSLQLRRGDRKVALHSLFSEDHLHALSCMYGSFDIHFVYQIAHLSCVYSRADDGTDSKIFSNNSRIKEYLPHFPLQSVVGLGFDTIYGKTQRALRWEKICSGKFFDILESFFKGLLSIYFFIINLWKFDKNGYILFKGQLWNTIFDRETISLKWKVRTKL